MNKYHKIKNMCPGKKSNSSIANNILMSLRFGAFSMKRVLYVSCVGRGDQSIRPTQLAITPIKGLIISVTSPYFSGLLGALLAVACYFISPYCIVLRYALVTGEGSQDSTHRAAKCIHRWRLGCTISMGVVNTQSMSVDHNG